MTQDIGGYQFQLIGPIEPERNPDAAVRQFMPQPRYRNTRNLPLNKHGSGTFCRFTVARDTTSSGVYIITVLGKPAYVGECRSLAQRFGSQGYGAIQPKNCFVGGQSTNCKINNLVLQQAKRGQTFELWF